jgi:Zn-dependent peptidase ImmA (M78 family)
VSAPPEKSPASRARAKAREVLADLKITSPELLKCLTEICVERGAFVKEQDLDGADARLVVSGNRGIITVRPDQAYPARTRFSIAHELGHFELHRAAESLWSCDTGESAKPRDGIESEANEFASELLMPEAFAKAELDAADPGLGLLKEFASRYQVSLSAAAHRFAELTDKPCAVVFSRSGKITYSIRSASFEKQRYAIPAGPLSAYSRAYEVHQGKPVPAGMSPVDATAWFQVPAYLHGQKLLEQSEYYRGIDLGISLLWLPAGRLVRNA